MLQFCIVFELANSIFFGSLFLCWFSNRVLLSRLEFRIQNFCVDKIVAVCVSLSSLCMDGLCFKSSRRNINVPYTAGLRTELPNVDVYYCFMPPDIKSCIQLIGFFCPLPTAYIYFGRFVGMMGPWLWQVLASWTVSL